MRYLIASIILLAAVEVQAAPYDAQVSAAFIQGCNKSAQTSDAATQAYMKKGCDCMLEKLEASETQAQFLNLPKTPDGGKAVLQPIALSCMQSK